MGAGFAGTCKSGGEHRPGLGPGVRVWDGVTDPLSVREGAQGALVKGT